MQRVATRSGCAHPMPHRPIPTCAARRLQRAELRASRSGGQPPPRAQHGERRNGRFAAPVVCMTLIGAGGALRVAVGAGLPAQPRYSLRCYDATLMRRRSPRTHTPVSSGRRAAAAERPVRADLCAAAARGARHAGDSRGGHCPQAGQSAGAGGRYWDGEYAHVRRAARVLRTIRPRRLPAIPGHCAVAGPSAPLNDPVAER